MGDKRAEFWLGFLGAYRPDYVMVRTLQQALPAPGVDFVGDAFHIPARDKRRFGATGRALHAIRPPGCTGDGRAVRTNDADRACVPGGRGGRSTRGVGPLSRR